MSAFSYRHKGFTLVEILIVLVLLAALTIVFGSRVSSIRTNHKSIVRHFKVLSRQLHTQAQLENATYRIVVSLGYTPEELNLLRDGNPEEKEKLMEALDDEVQEGAKRPHVYWVEKKETPEGDFLPDPKMMKKAKVLPPTLQFEKVLGDSTDWDKQDLPWAYYYFYHYPKGFTKAKVLQLRVKENYIWSLALHPLTGEVKIFDKEIEMDEAFEQQEK